MAGEIRKLIEKFEHTENKVAEAISGTSDASLDLVSELDGQLADAFEQLLKAKFEESGELIDRIRYLTERLKNDSENESLVGKIGNKILEDVNALTEMRELDLHKSVTELGEDRINSGELFETCYTSKATFHIQATELADLCTHAQNHNRKNDITGVLSFDPDTHRFMQILEGPRQPVEDLMKSIERDTRHEDVTVRFRNPTKNRCYSGWSMYLVPSSGVGLLNSG